MVGIAVNITFVPAQIVFPGLAVILTLAGRFGLTVIAMAFDVAGLPVAHVAFDVITQVTLFPLASPLFEYVALLVPTFVVPIFH